VFGDGERKSMASGRDTYVAGAGATPALALVVVEGPAAVVGDGSAGGTLAAGSAVVVPLGVGVVSP